MRELRFKVDEQNITKDMSCDFKNIVSGSDNYLICCFDFKSEYSDYGKVAEFKNDMGKTKYVLLENDRCVVEKQITEGSYFKIRLHLKKKDVAFSTNEVMISQI